MSVAPRCRQRYSPERGPDSISHPKEKKKKNAASLLAE
jgi:hypothetical protein